MTLLIATPILTLTSPQSSGPVVAASNIGEDVFRAKCTVCHGVDGSGRTANGKKLKTPDLRSEEVQKLSDDDLLEAIMNGKGYMPAFGKKTSAEKLRQVLSYLRSLGGKN